MVAVRQGGNNPEANFQLRLAIQKARDSNMPLENIERAIKRGSGEIEGVTLAEMVLEGYGPGGAAILVQVLTDNRNRTLQDIRNIFSKHNGSLGESGCVAWLFEPRGLITVPINDLDAEELELQAIDAGAEDVKVANNYVEVHTKPEDLEKTRAAMEQQNLTIASSELIMTSKNMVELEEKSALQTLKLLDKLEELDEVQHVTTNADFPEDILEKY
jgi:YebC/PmpR family DNA-binding regulatory protein